MITRAITVGLLLVLLPGVWQRTTLAAESGDYLVGDGDVLKVTVYDHPDLSTTVRVSSDGTVIFPLAGPVRIGGQGVAKVAETLERALAQGYIVNPQVSVFVQEFRSRKVIIMGQVTSPGLYELARPTTLLELISQAGGLTREAGATATVKRRPAAEGGREQLISVNLKSLMERGEDARDLQVMDGDSVFVAEAGTIYVTGEVNKPAAYRLEDGTSVIKAITMAGGFTDLAAKRRVKVIRKVEGKEKVIENVPMHTPVEPEDVIVVPESFF